MYNKDEIVNELVEIVSNNGSKLLLCQANEKRIEYILDVNHIFVMLIDEPEITVELFFEDGEEVTKTYLK